MIREQLSRVTTLARRISGRELDALDILRLDHMRLQTLFLRLKASRELSRQKRIWKQIRIELERHTELEESIFYPACEKNEKLKPLVLESREEHRQVKTLIKSIEGLADGSEKWQPKLYLLIENVEHHVHEEENSLFPKVRRAFDYEELTELGRELKAARKDRKAAA